MERLINKFLLSLEQRKQIIEQANLSVDQWISGSCSDNEVNDKISCLHDESHKLAGTAGSLGFESMSNRAFTLSRFIKSVEMTSNGAKSRESVQQIRALSESLILEVKSCIAGSKN